MTNPTVSTLEQQLAFLDQYEHGDDARRRLLDHPGAAAGDRNNQTTLVARMGLDHGIPVMVWECAVLSWNHERNHPPLPHAEIVAVVARVYGEDKAVADTQVHVPQLEPSRLYRRSFSPQMAQALLGIADDDADFRAAYRYVPQTPEEVQHARWLAHWGLLHAEPPCPASGIPPLGWYSLTDAGRAFVRKGAHVPRYAWFRGDTLERFEHDEVVGINELLDVSSDAVYRLLGFDLDPGALELKFLRGGQLQVRAVDGDETFMTRSINCPQDVARFFEDGAKAIRQHCRKRPRYAPESPDEPSTEDEPTDESAAHRPGDEFKVWTPEGPIDIRHNMLWCDRDASAPAGHHSTRVVSSPGTPERWLAFLREAMEGDAEMVEFLRRAVGYSLTGVNTGPVVFVCCGRHHVGKTVFLRTVDRIAGTYAGTFHDETLADPIDAQGALATFRDCRIAVGTSSKLHGPSLEPYASPYDALVAVLGW